MRELAFVALFAVACLEVLTQDCLGIYTEGDFLDLPKPRLVIN